MLDIEDGGDCGEEGKEVFPKLARNVVFAEAAPGH